MLCAHLRACVHFALGGSLVVPQMWLFFTLTEEK